MKFGSLINVVKSNRLVYSSYMVARDTRSYLQSRSAGMYSQHGEDVFIRDFFGAGFKGHYVDIGCSHPFRISNTYLLYKSGWRGLCVDAIPHFGWLYRFWRPGDLFVNVGVGATAGRLVYHELTPSVLSTFSAEYAAELILGGRACPYKDYEIKVVNPNELLEQFYEHKQIDVLSIDVESLDYEILSALDLKRFAPRLICVEFNDDTVRVALNNLLGEAGYDCSRTVGCNIMAIKR